MDKLKSVIYPGHKEDEEILYGDRDPSTTSRTSTERGLNNPEAISNTSNLPEDTTAGNHLSRPRPPTDEASAASIKSGVVGQAPVGISQLTDPATSARHEPDKSALESHREFPLTEGSAATTTHNATTAGPHSSNLANKADPRVDSDRDGSSTLGHTDGREGLASAAAPVYEHRGTAYENPEGVIPGTDRPAGGPHITTTANLLDPNVSGNGPRTATGTEHHYGRDAALFGGGAAAAGAYGIHQREQPNTAEFDSRDNTAGTIPVDLKQDTGPASHTVGPHKSNLANIVDPRVLPEPEKMKHHEAVPTEEDPATKTVGPHKSNLLNVVDPRVLPQPEKQKGHTTVGPHNSDTLNRLDPRVKSDPAAVAAEAKADQFAPPAQADSPTRQHHGRDAAVAGGAGAGAAGAWETAKRQRKHPQPGEDTIANPYSARELDPRVDVNPPPDSTQATNRGVQQTGESHNGRNVAAAGAAGLAGAGVYHEYNQHEPRQGAASGQQVPPPSRGTAHPTHAQEQTRANDYAQPQQKEHHYGRDAAAVGAAGSAAYGAHELSQKELEKRAEERAKELAKQREAQQQELLKQNAAQRKSLEHEQKQHQKEWEKQQKEHQKELHKEEKQHEKALAAAEKKHEKQEEKQHEKVEEAHKKALLAEKKRLEKEEEVERDRKLRQQEAVIVAQKKREHDEKERAEKEAKQREAAAEKEDEKGEKKHGFFHRLVHRHKDKKEGEDASRSSSEANDFDEHTRMLGASSGAAGLGAVDADPQTAAYQQNGPKHNKLHKDPPEDWYESTGTARSSVEGGPVGGQNTTTTTTTTTTGPNTTEEKYGVAQLAARDTTTTTAAAADGRVIEPHTGLPMDVDKYGTTGAGGVDANPTIKGYHHQEPEGAKFHEELPVRRADVADKTGGEPLM